MSSLGAPLPRRCYLEPDLRNHPVGAIVICCDIPWIRKYFGDSVYYIDQNLPDKALVRAILRCWNEIYSQPDIALDKARRAREIFEQRFAAELLIDNAVKYHERLSANRHAILTQRKASYEPFVSVIIRCGGRPVDLIRRALCSLSQQTYGQFEVIFVRYKDIDLSSLLSQPHANVRSMKVIDCLGAGRSTALWTGLSTVTADYFAVLDDDDWLFSNHFEKLFGSFVKVPKNLFSLTRAPSRTMPSPSPSLVVMKIIGLFYILRKTLRISVPSTRCSPLTASSLRAIS